MNFESYRGSGMTLWFTELQNRISKSNHTGAVCEILNNVVASNNSMTFKTVGTVSVTKLYGFLTKQAKAGQSQNIKLFS